MCDTFDDHHEDINDLTATVAKFGADAGVKYTDYDRTELSSHKIPEHNTKVGRQWTYEYCTQFGWF